MAFDFLYEISGISSNKGFVRSWTVYLKPRAEYSNLWVILLHDNGECEEFIEWWMEH